MINALVIEPMQKEKSGLLAKIQEFCPSVNCFQSTTCFQKAAEVANQAQTDLVFFPFEKIAFLHQLPIKSVELICFGVTQTNLADAIKYKQNAINFLAFPFTKENLTKCVNTALSRIQAKLLVAKAIKEDTELLGIPTMDGLEFFAIKDIVFCEGFQKCTRLVTTCNSRILSSYNIGEFRKILVPYNFYMPHKSFLINLKHIKKYHKEGTITMSSGQSVPVSRRKKREFLERVFHL